MASTPTPAPQPERVVIAVKVNFILNTTDELRRVVFGLEKHTDGNQIDWIINFQLFERESESERFDDPIVSLRVEVDTDLHPNADAVATNGLTPEQTAHAVGPAAEAAKAAQMQLIDPSIAHSQVQGTLR